MGSGPINACSARLIGPDPICRDPICGPDPIYRGRIAPRQSAARAPRRHGRAAYSQYTSTNSSSQTTSTKCQYHAAASNAKWWSAVKWPRKHAREHHRQHDHADGHVKPWKPVSMKNVEP